MVFQMDSWKRSDRRHSAIDNMTAAVWLHRCHEAKADEVKEVKQSHDQVLSAIL